MERTALSILRDIDGVTTEATSGDGRKADIVIHAGDVSHVVELKAQRSINAANARALIEQAQRLPKATHLLLVARSTTKEARRLLADAGVALIDGQGNMRVDLPGIFVWTERRPPHAASEKTSESPVKLTGKAGIATQALLGDPERWWQVNDLAAVAKISASLAHRVLSRLDRENLIETVGAGPKRARRVTHPAALLDLWAEEMRDRRVKPLRVFRLARDARAHATSLSTLLAGANIDHAVTGPAGAARLAPFITSIPVVDIWITQAVDLSAASNAIGAEVVQEGHNILLRQEADDYPLVFRTLIDDVWTVNKFRLYLDLRKDPRRGREQADRLREEVIGF
ncbi:hypothetical protein H7J51_13140 [Mycobacterium crocinum]|uniref:Transcriptional regulator n=1 Tax=Mycolicibacterium crocinum TaxID=388459 RepID=A0ABY3TI80_9MYCO|nr:hypothetical protein [Mycolicibacterium crocinum]MCV7216227.1 hypothetical protein [Mycolicibacterium crocinum]ULN41152.1 hypothetical protein MI149_26685 [Mycolicibacterium crocinum]